MRRRSGTPHLEQLLVPGLAAEPVLDVLLLVADVEGEASVGPLAPLGLTVRVCEPAHRMLRTATRDVHVHEPGRPEVQVYRAVCDRLRTDAGDRGLHEATKRELGILGHARRS